MWLAEKAHYSAHYDNAIFAQKEFAKSTMLEHVLTMMSQCTLERTETLLSPVRAVDQLKGVESFDESSFLQPPSYPAPSSHLPQ